MSISESTVVNSRRTGQSCPTHATKRGELYCLTCEVVVCAECLIGSREHGRHRVDTVRDTYAGRFQETRAKLESLNSHIHSLRRDVEKCVVVAETLRSNETWMLERLHRLMTEAKAQIEGSSKKYAEQLEPLLLIIRLKRHNRDRIVEKIKGLSEGQFLVQQADINKQCDGLMSNSLYLEQQNESDSIECSLLPSIETINLDLTLDGRRFIPLSYMDRYAVKWNLQLERTDKLLLHLDTKEMIDLRGNFLFVLEILDRPPLKKNRIVISIELSDTSSSSDHITKELSNDFTRMENGGSLSRNDILRIKYGIGPEDPIAERNCYEFTLQKYRNKLRSVRDELIEWKKYNTGHLVIYMKDKDISGSKKTVIQQSPTLLDASGVRWQLKIMINGKGTRGFVGAFLTKCSPQHEGWYDFFIELVHSRSEQQNRVFKGCHQFGKQNTAELPQFMAEVFLDKFLDNGTLRFRFGVKKEN